MGGQGKDWTNFRTRNYRKTVTTAYRETQFYRMLYDQYGVNPSEIRRVEDLKRLPVVTKDMLRKAYPLSCTRKNVGRWKEYYYQWFNRGRPICCTAG